MRDVLERTIRAMGYEVWTYQMYVETLNENKRRMKATQMTV